MAPSNWTALKMCHSLASGFHEETKDLLSQTLSLLCSPSTILCSYTPRRVDRSRFSLSVRRFRLLSLFVVSFVSHRYLCSRDVIHFLPEAYSSKLPSALRERFLHFHFRECFVYVERGKWWK
ncbi:hypothetical protein N665_0468s0003 [Sinapis alba]|nr:hypothetical protein N665_0468s0003 [Sinapis alba]